MADELNCLRCGHTWEPRGEGRPKQCPACHQGKWDTQAYQGKAWPGLTAEATGERLKRDEKKLSRKQTPPGTRQIADEIKKVVGPPVGEDGGDPFGFVAGVAAEPASDRDKRKGVKVKAAPALTDQDKTTYSPVED